LKRNWLLLLIGLSFILTSCLEAEVDIDLKRDGAGEMRMKIFPLDSSLNPIIHELESDIRKDKNYKDSDITKGTESDGRKFLFVRKKFNNVGEADPNCKFVSQKDHDEFIMSIPSDFLGIVKRVKVNMPGPIFESNVKNYEGRSLIWDRTSSSANRLTIKSKPPKPIGEIVTLIITALFVVGGVAIFIFKKIRNPKVVSQQYNFCPECGTKNNSDDNYCQNCGQSLR